MWLQADWDNQPHEESVVAVCCVSTAHILRILPALLFSTKTQEFFLIQSDGSFIVPKSQTGCTAVVPQSGDSNALITNRRRDASDDPCAAPVDFQGHFHGGHV